MYTLRLLLGDHSVTNHDMGNSYTVSYPDSVAFEKELSQFDGTLPRSDVKALIQGENGFSTLIFKGQPCFIMTDSGKTFERL